MEIRPYITADTDDPAYNCGRILAILSQTQKKALGNWNLSGVAERYFGTASAAPATVLPLLIRLNRHHLDKIRKSGGSVYEEKILRDVLACFKGKDDQPPAFPRYLDLQAQGRFALGFYQQQAEDENARVAVKVMTYLNETDAPTHTEMLALQESDLQIFYENINQHYGSASFKEWSDKKRKKETVVSSPSVTNTSSD